MADEKALREARAAYSTLCKALDGHNWRYRKNDQELRIDCGAQGEDLPMDLIIKVDAERHLVTLLSHMPFVVPGEKRLDMAVAVSVVNNCLIDGSFDYDIKSGHIFFRMTNSFLESTLGADAFFYLVLCSCKTIDDFNDKFMMIAKGHMTIEQFIDQL